MNSEYKFQAKPFYCNIYFIKNQTKYSVIIKTRIKSTFNIDKSVYLVYTICMKFRELNKLLNKHGWYLDYVNGSHHHYYHDNEKYKITFNVHSGEVGNLAAYKTLKKLGIKGVKI